MISRDGDTNIPPAPRLHPRGHDIPLPLSAPQLPRTVLARSTSGSAAQALKAAADELREKQRFMRTPAWEDFSSEEQAKFMHEVYVHHPVLLYPPPFTNLQSLLHPHSFHSPISYPFFFSLPSSFPGHTRSVMLTDKTNRQVSPPPSRPGP